MSFLPTSGLPIQPIIGTIFVLCILLFRNGVVGTLDRWLKRSAPERANAVIM